MEILTLLGNFSPIGIIALLSYIVYLQISQHKQLQTNDLHVLEEIADAVRRIEVGIPTILAKLP